MRDPSELDPAAREGSADTAAWEPLGADTYLSVAKGLVHHSFKTVNSNASAGGVRLGADAALDAPYVCARTLLAAEVELDLDYVANSGKTAKVVKQMRAALAGTPLAAQASAEEVAAIRSAAAAVAGIRHETGTDSVDARMRQLMLPRDDGTYLCITPVTASGVCSLLLDATSGLVSRHNAEAAEQRRRVPSSLPDGVPAPAIWRIQRAQLGIGGSNPQNVGALVRAMQQPMFLPGPTGSNALRSAFRIYYRGIELPVPVHLVADYHQLRGALAGSGGGATRMSVREAEEVWARRVAGYYLAVGADALESLRAFEDALPKEHTRHGDLSGSHELVSRKVKASIRGLIDPSLRDDAWPRQIATTIVQRLQSERIRSAGDSVAALPLDAGAQAKIAALLEEAIR